MADNSWYESDESVLQKKTNCRTCSYYLDGVCRVGRGNRPIKNPIGYCEWYYRLRPNRCGKCRWFVDNFCKLHKDYRNFYDFCYSSPGYEEEKEKDIKI